MALSTTVGLEFIARDRSQAGMASFNRQLNMVTSSVLHLAGIGGGIYALQRGFAGMIRSASDAEETLSKFNVVFREQSAAASRWAEDFGDKVGRSTQDVQKWMASLQDLFVPLGFARDKSMELSQSLTQLAVDVASFNNQADADVIRDFTSALVGNHEAVRKYGIIITEASLKQEALNKGITKNYAELTNLEKVSLRYGIIQQSTTDAQGDAIRTADSYANQVKRLHANLHELSVEMGNELLPALSDMLTAINENKDAWAGFFKLIGRGIGEMARLPETLDAITTIIRNGAETKVDIERYRGWGGFVPPGGPQGLPEGRLEYSPRSLQRMAEMRAAQRAMREGFQGQALPGTEYGNIGITDEILTKEQLAADKRMIQLRRQVAEEIELTGRLNEPRQHAKMMIDFQAEAAARYGENTQQAIEATKQFEQQLRQLEKAESLARIAEDIGQAFSTAFEDAILNAKNLQEVMQALANSIQRAFFQEIVSKPLAQFFAGMAGNMMGAGGTAATVAHGGGRVGSIGARRFVDSSVFDSAPRFHDLRPGETAIIAQDDEVISRPGRRITGGEQQTINNNFYMQMIDGSGARAFFDAYSAQVSYAQSKELRNNRGRRNKR